MLVVNRQSGGESPAPAVLLCGQLGPALLVVAPAARTTKSLNCMRPPPSHGFAARSQLLLEQLSGTSHQAIPPQPINIVSDALFSSLNLSSLALFYCPTQLIYLTSLSAAVAARTRPSIYLQHVSTREVTKYQPRRPLRRIETHTLVC